MNLEKKKRLAARTLKIGYSRVRLDPERFEEIKEAITALDIKDLVRSKAIEIKPIRGRKKIVKRKTRRGPGKIKKKVKNKKQEYVKRTRKLRRHVKIMKKQGLIDAEKNKELRNHIRASRFKSKAHLKETLAGDIKPLSKQTTRNAKGKKKITKKRKKK